MGFFRHLFKPLDRAAFAQAVVDALVAAGRGEAIKADLEEFVVQYGDKRSFYLGNLYGEYERAGAFSRSRVFGFVLQQALATAPPIPENFAAARQSLLPSVRDPLTFDLQRLLLPEGEAGKYRPAYQMLGDCYCVSVVHDGATTMSYVNQDQFTTWDVPLSRALEYALDNLAARPANVETIAPGLFAFDTRDSYDAARLLLKDRVRALALRGRPVAAIPNRECLLLTGEDDRDGLERLARLIEERFDHPRAIGTCPLVLDGEAWRPFVPPGSDALAVRYRNLAVKNQGTRYADQKRVLEKLYEKRGTDVFVASFSGFSAKGGDTAIHSYCVWSQGVPSLLPKTDLVAFVGNNRDQRSLYPWDLVVAEVGALMKPQQMVPERWSVTEFPSPEALSKLAPHTVEH